MAKPKVCLRGDFWGAIVDGKFYPFAHRNQDNGLPLAVEFASGTKDWSGLVYSYVTPTSSARRVYAQVMGVKNWRVYDLQEQV